MFQRLVAFCCVSLLAGLVLLPTPPRVEACAAAWGKGGPGARVEIVTESALIIWDAKAKRQHFIRRASFDAKVPYFGFLVPTPTIPDLAEAPDELFKQLEDWTKPEVREEIRYENVSLMPFGCAADSIKSRAMDKGMPAGAVEVLDTVHVAGYKAQPIKANDAEALRKWLEERGFDARPELTKWLEPYVKANWIITAFQIEKTQKEKDSLSPQAVRMSFTTDRPFFPYREPPDKAEEKGRHRSRLLRVFFVGDGRMHGEYDGGEFAWPDNRGAPEWAGPLDPDRRQTIEKGLAQSGITLPEGAWLTVFDDRASSRAEKPDVHFSLAREQSEIRRPPIIHYRIVKRTPPEEIIGLVVCLGMLLAPPIVLVWLLRRLSRRQAQA